jgi:hypothetical protein
VAGDGVLEKLAKAPENVPSGKRKRGAFTDDDLLAFTNMFIAMKDIVEAIQDNKPTYMHLDLYQAIKVTGGFTEESLLTALTHIVDHKAHDTSFVGMVPPNRLWLRIYLGKYYYNM